MSFEIRYALRHFFFRCNARAISSFGREQTKLLPQDPMKLPYSRRSISLSARPETDLTIEQLEPRVLFSAAPVDADVPADTGAQDVPAQEAPAVAVAESAPPAASPSPVEIAAPAGEAQVLPEAQGASDISASREVVLVDVEGSEDEGHPQVAGEATPTLPEANLQLLPTDTTSVGIDSDDNLVVEDILGGDTKDRLFIGVVDGRLEVRDSRNTVGTSIADAIEVGNRGRGVSIALDSFSGDIIVRMQGGDDRITIGDLEGLPNGIVIEDGEGHDLIRQKGEVALNGGAKLTYSAEQIRLERRSSLATENGKITLNGNVDETSQKRSTGVRADGSRISSQIGAIEINGIGGASGSANRGVYLKNTEITSISGIVDIAGTGGSSESGSRQEGIHLARGTSISTGSDADLTLLGDGGTGKNGNRGVYLQSGVTVQTDQGGLFVFGTGGIGKNSNAGFVAGKATLSTMGPDRLLVAGYGVGTGSDNVGIQLRGTMITASGDGQILVQGVANNPFQGSRNFGLDMRSATITATSGDTVVQGAAGRGKNANIAVRADRTAISSENANVTITGTAINSSTGNQNRGIDIKRSTISSGRDLSVVGTGGPGVNHNSGVRMNATQMTAGENISMTGTARDRTTGISNRGIELRNTDLSALSVALNGKGGNGTDKNAGLHIQRGFIVARAGDADLTGEAFAGASGSHNRGVELLSARIQAGANAVITGIGGGGEDHNQGVRMIRGSVEAGPASGVEIHGQARNTTVGSSNMGAYLFDSITLKGGNLLMNGIGGGGIDNNHGLFADRDITADAEPLSFNGTGGAGLTSENFAGDFFD